MNEIVFNTLASVALMCSAHFHGLLTGDFMPVDGKYDAGFEQCAAIAKALEAEKRRRAEVAAAKQLSDDKARVANALSALQGKKFTAELAPPQPLWTNTCIMPATGTQQLYPQ